MGADLKLPLKHLSPLCLSPLLSAILVGHRFPVGGLWHRFPAFSSLAPVSGGLSLAFALSLAFSGSGFWLSAATLLAVESSHPKNTAPAALGFAGLAAYLA